MNTTIQNYQNSDIKDAESYAKFTVDIREKLMENYWKEMPLLFQHVQALMSILGLIAGFGFTAFQYIKNQTVFFSGEFLVIGSVIYLVYRLKIYISGQPMSTEKMINDYQEKARQIKQAILEKNLDKMTEFAKEFRKNVNNTSVGPKVETAKILNGNLEIALILSIIGVILIFTSFIICS